MSFFETVWAQPGLLPYWVTWLTFISTIAWIVLFTARRHWRDAGLVLGANILVTVSMQWLFDTRGYGPVLSLPHLLFWAPLLAYLALRLRAGAFHGPYLAAVLLLSLSLAVSLMFDLRDALGLLS